MGGKDVLYSSIQSCCNPGKRSNNSIATGKGGVSGYPPLSLEEKSKAERESDVDSNNDKSETVTETSKTHSIV